MKNIILFTVMFLSFGISAQNIPTNLKSATVFFSGAELTHTATVAVKSGENAITLEGLSPVIDINSLKINVSNSVVVAASEFSTDFLVEKTETDLVKKLQDSIDFCNAEIAALKTSIDVNASAYQLLKKSIETNFSIVEKGKTTAEITQNLDYFNEKANAYEKAIYNYKKKQEELNKTLNRLNLQLSQEKNKNGTKSGILKLTLVASVAANTTVTVTYYTSFAGWTPYYDMNIASTDKPVVLQRRSKVRQTTGLDWNKVSLTLSTAQPSRGKDAPLFSTWFLNYVTAYQSRYQNAAVQNTISYDKKEADVSEVLQGRVAGVEVQNVSGTFGAAPKLSVRGATSVYGNAYPLWVIDGVVLEGFPEFSADELSSEDPATLIASKVSGLNANDIKDIQFLKDASATALYGARGMAGVIVVTTKGMDDYIITEEKQISEEYKIDLPYTIPGNGKEQIIDLKRDNLQATYKYYCAPRLDENVYLIAEFTGWEKLNLLSGQANVTYDGTFVGQTYLNTQSAQKTLSVTLGTDKRVTVKREKMMDFSSVKLLSSDTKVTLTYKISVKNNQNKSILLVLKDQYPISQQKDIEVELLKKETTTPTVNKEETGVITWESEFAAGESKEYRIAYSVKYPKGRKINL